MINKIELYDRYKKFSCKFICNEKLISTSGSSHRHIFDLAVCPAHIKIEISPNKIRPLIRLDDVAVNYGLAKITPWDHMIEFKVDENFFDTYFENILKAKQNYLKIDSQTLYKQIGYRQDFDNLIEKINDNIK